MFFFGGGGFFSGVRPLVGVVFPARKAEEKKYGPRISARESGFLGFLVDVVSSLAKNWKIFLSCL